MIFGAIIEPILAICVGLKGLNLPVRLSFVFDAFLTFDLTAVIFWHLILTVVIALTLHLQKFQVLKIDNFFRKNEFFPWKFIDYLVKSKQTLQFDGKNPTFKNWQFFPWKFIDFLVKSN